MPNGPSNKRKRSNLDVLEALGGLSSARITAPSAPALTPMQRLGDFFADLSQRIIPIAEATLPLPGGPLEPGRGEVIPPDDPGRSIQDIPGALRQNLEAIDPGGRIAGGVGRVGSNLLGDVLDVVANVANLDPRGALQAAVTLPFGLLGSIGRETGIIEPETGPTRTPMTQQGGIADPMTRAFIELDAKSGFGSHADIPEGFAPFDPGVELQAAMGLLDRGMVERAKRLVQRQDMIRESVDLATRERMKAIATGQLVETEEGFKPASLLGTEQRIQAAKERQSERLQAVAQRQQAGFDLRRELQSASFENRERLQGLRDQAAMARLEARGEQAVDLEQIKQANRQDVLRLKAELSPAKTKDERMGILRELVRSGQFDIPRLIGVLAEIGDEDKDLFQQVNEGLQELIQQDMKRSVQSEVSFILRNPQLNTGDRVAALTDLRLQLEQGKADPELIGTVKQAIEALNAGQRTTLELQAPTAARTTALQALQFTAESTLDLIDDLREVLRPENVGLIGDLRGAVFGAAAQFDAFAQLLLRERDNLTQVADARGDTLSRKWFSDPNLSKGELLSNMLAYRVALVNNPDGRISNPDFENARDSLGAEKVLANVPDILARLEAVERLTKRDAERARKRLDPNAAVPSNPLRGGIRSENQSLFDALVPSGQ